MKKKVLIIGILLLLLVFSVLFFAAQDQMDEEVHEASGTAPHAPERQLSLTNGREECAIRSNIETLLLIGVDTAELPSYDTKEDESFANAIQCDVLVLLVIDNSSKTVTPIQISRDTMCDIPWLDVTGEYGGTFFGQIALAYNSGSGRNDSCEIVKQTVSDVLFDAPINHYLALSMEGIGVLTDLVGGVPVTIEEDMTKVDPSFVAGTTVTLHGKQAESYVRARKSMEDDTNTARMARQRNYFESFVTCAKEAVNSESDLIMKAFNVLAPYMVTDMTTETLSSVIKKLDTYEMKNVLVPYGRLEEGKYYELYLDEEELWEIVKKAFCNNK